MLDDDLFDTFPYFSLHFGLKVSLSNSRILLCSRNDIVTILDGRDNRTVKFITL